MVRGTGHGVDLDQDWFNLAHRLNNGNAFTGNVAMKWYFYDPLGPGGTNFQDFADLAYSGTASPTSDYTGNGSFMGFSQHLSLGAYAMVTGMDTTKYQIGIVGATDGPAEGGEFFNVGTRSVGWHLAEILLGPNLGRIRSSASTSTIRRSPC